MYGLPESVCVVPCDHSVCLDVPSICLFVFYMMAEVLLSNHSHDPC